jgi:hypothetical protein
MQKARPRRKFEYPLVLFPQRNKLRYNGGMMNKVAKVCGLAFVAVVWLSASAAVASVQCPDCPPDKDTIREAIKAERARDDERRAKESTDRPWTKKDFGKEVRPDVPVIVR